MTKYLTIAFNANLLFTFLGYFLDNEYITYVGYVLIIPILFVLYGTLRKWQTTKIDVIMYVAFLFGFLSDIITSAILGNLGIIIQISCSLIANFLFFYIFRLEGSYIIISSRRDFWRFIIPLIPCVILFSIILISNIKDTNLYFLSGFYGIFSYLFLLNTIFLSVRAKSKLLALLGVTSRILSDAIFSIIVFLHVSNVTILFINFLFYAYSQYFIVLSVLTSDSKFLGNNNDYLKTLPELLSNALDRFEHISKKI